MGQYRDPNDDHFAIYCRDGLIIINNNVAVLVIVDTVVEVGVGSSRP